MNILQETTSSKSFGCGNHFGHSIETWRRLVRQAWLRGFLNRVVAIGSGHNMVSSIAYASYTLTDVGTNYLRDDELPEILLPDLTASADLKEGPTTSSHITMSSEVVPTVLKVRKGKGTHAINVVKELMSDKKNWFSIERSDDYNYPGVFSSPYPQRLGYCEDVSRLPNYEADDPHFLYSDIQIGKGKARPKRLIQMNIDGNSEGVYYRLTPCGGVKRCGLHTEGCSLVVSTNAIKPCSQHPQIPLERSGECPVDFIYIWPENIIDNRRWLTGIVRCGDLQVADLHNHPHHKESKIPVKVDSDIRRAVLENPHLKPSEVLTGMYLNYCRYIFYICHYVSFI